LHNKLALHLHLRVLSSKPESNAREHCNCITLKEGNEDLREPEDIPLKEGREIIMVESKERNDGGKPITFTEMIV